MDVIIRWTGGEQTVHTPWPCSVGTILELLAEARSTTIDSITLLQDQSPLLDPKQFVYPTSAGRLVLQAIISEDNAITTNDSPAARLKATLDAQSDAEELNLRSSALTPDLVSPELLPWLADHNRIRTIYLSDNFLGDEGCIDFARWLGTNPTLYSLSLNRNYITDYGLHKLAEVLTKNTNLVHLELEENDFSAPGSTVLASLIQRNNTLCTLLIDGFTLDGSVKALLGRHGAVTKNIEMRSRLHQAIEARDTATVTKSVTLHVDAWTLLPNGQNVLHLACRSGSVAILQALLDYRHSANRTNNVDGAGRSALHIACELNNWDAALLLIQRGCDPELKDFTGKTPLSLGDSRQFVAKLSEDVMTQLAAGKDARSALQSLVLLRPNILSTLFDDFAPIVSRLLSSSETEVPLPRECLSALKQIEGNNVSSALDALDALLKSGREDMSANPNVQTLFCICALLLKHYDAQQFVQKFHAQHPALFAFQLLLIELNYNSPASLGPKRRRLFGAAATYFLSKLDQFPKKWTSTISELLQSLPSEEAVARAAEAASASQGGCAPLSRQEALKHRVQVIKQRYPSMASNLEELMQMIGLWSVKETMVQLFENIGIIREQGLSFQDNPMHARFEGNPGTGKSTVVDLYCKILKDAGVLPPRAILHRSTGTKLKMNGKQNLMELLDKFTQSGGGVLFVDEAYQLNPVKDNEGASILNIIMDEMLERKNLIVVFAGYKKQIEKLIEYNPGLPSRFPRLFHFEDYSDEELTDILSQNLTKRGFSVEDAKWIRVAARRLGRGRGKDGFGNARDCANLANAALDRQRKRITIQRTKGDNPNVKLLLRDDLLGPKATRESLVQSSKAYKKLQDLYGLQKVKQAIDRLIDVAARNGELEDREERLIDRLNLNRVFLGNPGTGKTTVAKLYGQILSELGLLTKSEVIFKTASDFNGSVIGQATEATVAILESAKGCVLVIDEAYGLDPQGSMGGKGDPYKNDVINTLVEKVQVGDDIAVVMLGYREQMESMIRNANEGLARRFNLDEALIFEDYDDDALFRIMGDKCEAAGLRCGLDATRAAVAVLSRQRNLPNFGNAGAAGNLLNNAQQRMQDRIKHLPPGDPAAKELVAADFKVEYAGEAPTDAELGPMLAQKRAQMANIVTNARAAGRSFAKDIDYGYLFVGPPGTGKTTSARLVGRMMASLGILASSEVLETSVQDFLTGYAQQAGKRTEEIFQKALGKVLFIDEAYALKNQDPNGEVLSTICALMTKTEYLGKLVVVLAGYDREISDLLATNSGLESRFRARISFEPWDTDKSIDVLKRILDADNIDISPAALKMAKKLFPALIAAPGWSSGRDVTFIRRELMGGLPSGSNTVDDELIESVLTNLIQDRMKRAAEMEASLANAPAVVGSTVALPALGAGPVDQPSTSTASATRQKAKIEELEDDAHDDPSSKVAQGGSDGQWFGMDIESELKPLNAVLEALKWDGADKVEELTHDDPETDHLREQLVKELVQRGAQIDEAKRIVKKWVLASEERRKAQHAAEIQARLLSRKPIIQCQVCKRKANYWSPCYVAPMQIGWEEVELSVFKARKNI